MIKKIYLLSIAVLLFAACSKERETDEVSDFVEYDVSMPESWINGREVTTRAEAAPQALLPDGVKINATPKEGEGAPTLTENPFAVIASKGYTAIQNSYIDKYDYIAYWPGNYVATEPPAGSWNENSLNAFLDKDYLLAKGDKVTISSNLIIFSLAHQTALVRLFLRVDQAYLKLRGFKVTSLKVSGNNQQVDGVGAVQFSLPASAYLEGGKVLTKDNQLMHSFYVNPDKFATLKEKKFKVTATYDVYDLEGQLTRKDCTASNNLDLSYLFPKKDENGVVVSGETGMERGRYYDIIVTLAPDFLYVLSDNDNKSDLELK